MSLFNRVKPRPATYAENGHGMALRDGNAYCFYYGATILAGATVKFRFTTGAKAVRFYSGDVNMNQESLHLHVYEDVTFTDGGVLDATIGCPMNRLKSAKVPLTQFYTNPTVDNEGTLFMDQHIKGIAGQNINKPGFGTGGGGGQRILKPNTEHTFNIVNDSAADNDIDVHMIFHEVNPREYE